jgi:hypothetical protein
MRADLRSQFLRTLSACCDALCEIQAQFPHNSAGIRVPWGRWYASPLSYDRGAYRGARTNVHDVVRGMAHAV